jgi:hypothetical protein
MLLFIQENMKNAKSSPKVRKTPDRDSKGRFWSNRQLIRVIILTIAAAILAISIWQLDAKYNPVQHELFNPLVEDAESKELSVSEIIANREKATVTQLIAERFGEYADQAVKVAFCESRLNRTTISSTQDYGVFQLHKPVWFHEYQLDDESALLAYENIAVAYDIFKNNGYKWSAWYSSYKCHGLR